MKPGPGFIGVLYLIRGKLRYLRCEVRAVYHAKLATVAVLWPRYPYWSEAARAGQGLNRKDIARAHIGADVATLAELLDYDNRKGLVQA
jgi:hypothetical protein